MKSLLNPGERVEFVVDELNLFLPGSCWVGVTPVRLTVVHEFCTA